jgi:hypothetical protein
MQAERCTTTIWDEMGGEGEKCGVLDACEEVYDDSEHDDLSDDGPNVRVEAVHDGLPQLLDERSRGVDLWTSGCGTSGGEAIQK